MAKAGTDKHTPTIQVKQILVLWQLLDQHNNIKCNFTTKQTFQVPSKVKAAKESKSKC